MTDDLEPRLEDHLRHRASRVQSTSDLADVHHRIDHRQRRRTRALGTALAIALVAGPVAGFAVAQSMEEDRDTVSAAGGDDVGIDAFGGSGGGTYDGSSVSELRETFDPVVEPVSARTTADGIRIVVHSTDLSGSDAPMCTVDGVVRVGVVDGDLVDVVHLRTSPGGSSFVLAGVADDRPMWIVVTRGYEGVEATFANGATDSVESTDGLAVLAAYADPSMPVDALAAEVVELDGQATPGLEDVRTAAIEDGSGGCPDTVAQPIDPPVTMPEPGEPPADEDAARAEIEAVWEGSFGREADATDFRERPAVYADAQARFQAEQPQYYAWAQQVYAVVDEIVFTAPDRASVRATLKSDNPEIPIPEPQIGEAVLIDGKWMVSIESSCSGFALAGIECDMSIEG